MVQKNKNYLIKNIPLEEIDISKSYSISLNLSLPLDPLVSNVRRYIRLCKTLSIYMNGFVRLELSPVGRLHAHGIIQYKSYPKVFYFYLWLRNHCNFNMEIDTIKDEKEWLAYTFKQHRYAKMYEAVGHNWMITLG